ncbi:MAG: NAD(+) synthase [Fibrobacteres bacterium]|nr:NAD(+) synthase [Fibrobacterota bacterium]
MIKIAIAQMQVFPGDPARNGARMLELLDGARGLGAHLIAFPEMCLPGYLLGDMWERPAFLRECESWAARIVAATGPGGPGEGLAAVFGTVIPEWGRKGEDGRPRKYNGYIAAQDGVAAMHPGLGRPYGIKTLLPNYREFEEPRHFQDARKLALETGRPLESLLEPIPMRLGGRSVRAGILLCEDAWEDDYAQKPLAILGSKGCDFLLNLSCSPFTQGKNEKRSRVFAHKVRAIGAPLLYVNCTGLQNNGKTLYTFDGRSTAYAADGSIRAELPAFEEALLPLSLDDAGGRLDWAPADEATAAEDEVGSPGTTGAANGTARAIREIHQALRFGAREFLDSIGTDRVVIGVSGGIDSAVAAALYREFLPPQNILLANMPSRYNSATTRDLSRRLAENLGCLYAELPIEDSVNLTQAQLDGAQIASLDGAHSAPISLAGFVMENVQARDRSSRILAALAAAFGGVFTCNANKAELTVGYSTLYGDLGGFLALIGDLWKGEVYALGRYLNDEVFGREAIPEGIFNVVPSAELGAHQSVDEGKGDPLIYPYHDRLFFSWVQRWNRATPEEILEWYAAGTLNSELGLDLSVADVYRLFPDAQGFVRDLERWWNLYNGIAVAKRVQAPPILAISSRAFGFDHRESLGAPFYSVRYREMRERLLGGGTRPG